ncbi:MAG: AI-2E family transporter [Ignavibacteriales bacterium]|nr:AI-2E family transporter [Ignavibacteriales bacterium]
MSNEQNNSDAGNKSSLIIPSIGGIILFFVLLYQLLPGLSPFFTFIALLIILYPFRHYVFISRLILVSGILFFVWAFSSLINIISPFVISLLIAYLLNPLVNILERKKIPRWTSSIIIMGIFIGMISLSIMLILPIILTQFQGIFENITEFGTSIITSLRQGTFIETLGKTGIPVENLRAIIEQELPKKMDLFLKTLFEGAFGLVTNLTNLITQLINIILIPFITFYFLKDFPEIVATVGSFVPEKYKEKVFKYFTNVDEVLSDYFRGALIVALIQGIVSTIVLSILGVKYAFVLGIMTMLLDFIPYVGLLISMVVSLVVAMFSGEPVTVKLIGVIVMYLAQKIIENTVLAPKIIGDKIGLHPILLMISLFIFGYIFGFIGLLIAVPTTAILIMSVKTLPHKKITERD